MTHPFALLLFDKPFNGDFETLKAIDAWHHRNFGGIKLSLLTPVFNHQVDNSEALYTGKCGYRMNITDASERLQYNQLNFNVIRVQFSAAAEYSKGIFPDWSHSDNNSGASVAENDLISPQSHHTTCGQQGGRPMCNYGQTMAEKTYKKARLPWHRSSGQVTINCEYG